MTKRKNRLFDWAKRLFLKCWAWIKPYLTTWQGITGMIVSWCLIDGWPWLLLMVGGAYHITWMWALGLAVEAILWQPWMIEKPLVVIPLGILFKKLLDKLSKGKKKEKKL